MMKKIVELLIDIDDIDFEGFVDTMSLVDKPAIGIDWMAFAQESFVEPTAGETEDEFIGRCIPKLIEEGYTQEQAAAICYSYWEEGFCEDCFDEEGAKEELMKLVDEYGEEYDPENSLIVDLSSEEFSTLEDIAKAVTAIGYLDKRTLKKEQLEQRYRYAGPRDSGNRPFCSKMLGLNKLFSLEEIRDMEDRLSRFGAPRRGQAYSVLQFKGGRNCRHAWHSVKVKKVDDRTLLLDEGPVTQGNTIDTLTAAEATNAGQIARPSNDWWSQDPGYRQGFQEHVFQVVSEDQQVIVGPSMIPQKLIPRRDEEGNLFYVYFSQETIRKIAEKFIKEGYLNNTDVNHDFNVTTENTLLESWIIEDPEKDKSAMYGYDLPTGTWMTSYKINNKETWDKIKSGELRGYSIAGTFLERMAK